ncbi:uncharacterized protein METZ01_LOCUS476768, partial [marine metagenome]
VHLYGGKQGDESLKEIEIDNSYVTVPATVPEGPAFNIAQLWQRFADGVSSGERIEPDFQSAVKRHELLDAIQNASDTGSVQYL